MNLNTLYIFSSNRINNLFLSNLVWHPKNIPNITRNLILKIGRDRRSNGIMSFQSRRIIRIWMWHICNIFITQIEFREWRKSLTKIILFFRDRMKSCWIYYCSCHFLYLFLRQRVIFLEVLWFCCILCCVLKLFVYGFDALDTLCLVFHQLEDIIVFVYLWAN